MRASSHTPAAANLPALAAGAAPGSAWEATMEDLRARLVVVEAGGELPGHVNQEADLVIVGVAGAGSVEVDGASHSLGPGEVVAVPKGSRRRVSAGGADLAFLAVHRLTAVTPAWRWRPRRRRPWEDPWEEIEGAGDSDAGGGEGGGGNPGGGEGGGGKPGGGEGGEQTRF